MKCDILVCFGHFKIVHILSLKSSRAIVIVQQNDIHGVFVAFKHCHQKVSKLYLNFTNHATKLF